MKKFKKVLSVLTAVAMLISSGVIVFAEDQIEEAAPVVEETPAAEETVQEEAPVVEETPVQVEEPVVEETPVQVEEPVVEETPVQEEPAGMIDAPGEGHRGFTHPPGQVFRFQQVDDFL